MPECGLANMSECIAEKIFGFLSDMINDSIEPFLNTVHTLLSQPMDINSLFPVWSVMVYIISAFYGVFFMWSGFQFIISGYDARKRAEAKSMLRNLVLMIILVQFSFIIYDLLLEVGGALTTGILDMVNQELFLPHAGNGLEFGVQLILGIVYVATLLITIILLGLRYILIGAGVLFFPFIIASYFIPPLHKFGKMALRFLVTLIFVPTVAAIVLVASSALLEIGIFEGMKVALNIIVFLGMDIVMIVMMGLMVISGFLSSKVKVARRVLGTLRKSNPEDKSQKKITSF